MRKKDGTLGRAEERRLMAASAQFGEPFESVASASEEDDDEGGASKTFVHMVAE